MARQEVRNFEVVHNNTWKGFTSTITVNGEPIKIASVSIPFKKDGTTVLEKTSSSGISISSTVDGQFILNEFLVTLAKGKYTYEVITTLESGAVKTYQLGDFVVE